MEVHRFFEGEPLAGGCSMTYSRTELVAFGTKRCATCGDEKAFDQFEAFFTDGGTKRRYRKDCFECYEKATRFFKVKPTGTAIDTAGISAGFLL